MREEVVGFVNGKLKLNRKLIGLFKNQYRLATGLQASSQTSMAHVLTPPQMATWNIS